MGEDGPNFGRAYVESDIRSRPRYDSEIYLKLRSQGQKGMPRRGPVAPEVTSNQLLRIMVHCRNCGSVALSLILRDIQLLVVLL